MGSIYYKKDVHEAKLDKTLCDNLSNNTVLPAMLYTSKASAIAKKKKKKKKKRKGTASGYDTEGYLYWEYRCVSTYVARSEGYDRGVLDGEVLLGRIYLKIHGQ